MQEVVAAQNVVAEQHALLEGQGQYVQQQEARQVEHLQHLCDTPGLRHTEALGRLTGQHDQQSLQLKLQHQGAVEEVQAVFEGQLRQQQADHDTAVACIRAELATQLQQLDTEHTAILSETVNTAKDESCQQLAQQHRLHEKALKDCHAEMSRQAEQQQLQMIAEHEGSMLSLKADHSRQMDQQQSTLSTQHAADLEALRQECKSALEEDIADLQSKLQLAESEAAALRSQLDQELCPIQKLGAQIDAKVLVHLTNGLQLPCELQNPRRFQFV